jgi:hypothetical protein
MVRELGNTRITLYNPIEAAFSAALWDTLDPGTSIYLGSPDDLKQLREMIGILPDKRTTFAGQLINDAQRYAASGNYRDALKVLAGAAQVLGKIRLRGEIVRSCLKEEAGALTFGRFLRETETARKTIDVLWRFQTGDGGKISEGVPVEPVSISIGELEVGEFTALCRNLGIVCIAAKSGEMVTVSLDKHDLEEKTGKMGTANVPQFPIFFEEVTDPAPSNRDRLIRIRDVEGIVRYYDLKKE